MRLEEFARTLGQAFASALADSGNFKFSGDAEDAVPLDELDLTGAPPTGIKVSLSRKDGVRVVQGEGFAVAVEGDESSRENLLFKLGEETLRIFRRHGKGDPVEITVTLPELSKIAIGGSGRIIADTMVGDARIAIGGSGEVTVDAFTGEKLTAKIGGSGRIVMRGSVEMLDLTIGGSGNFDSEHLEVGQASIRIGGSGSVEMSSDGEIDAKIGGSGEILVHGNARCSLKAGGSGKFRSVPRGTPGPLDEAA